MILATTLSAETCSPSVSSPAYNWRREKGGL